MLFMKEWFTLTHWRERDFSSLPWRERVRVRGTYENVTNQLCYRHDSVPY